MVDEQTPDEKQEPGIDASETQEGEAERSKLEFLPAECKRELDGLIASGAGYRMVRKHMIERFGAQFPGVNAHESTYRRYIEANKERIETEKQLMQQMIAANNETTEGLKELMEVSMNPQASLDDKKAVLTKLFQQANARSRLLETRNQTYIDPQIEALILAYGKEQARLLDQMTKLQDSLNKTADVRRKEELVEYSKVVVAVAYQAYQKIHGNFKYAEYHETFKQDFLEMMKGYNDAKERLMKQQPDAFK